MELSGFMPIVKRWWWLLAAGAVVGVVAGFQGASRIEPTYEARVRLLVGPIAPDLETQRAAGQLAQTLAEVVASRSIREAAAERVGRERIGAGDVEASANDVTRILTVRARSHDAEESASIANALVASLREFAGARPGIGQLRTVDQGRERGSQVAPRTTLIAGMAGVLGLLVSLALVIGAEYLRDRVRGEEDVQAAAGLGVLASVARTRRRRRGLLAELDPSAVADYAVLAARIGIANGSGPGRAILVVGAQQEDGSGVLAANLASVVARTGTSVALVDAAREWPEISRGLGLDRNPGLGEALEDQNEPISRLLAECAGMTVLPRGAISLPEPVDPQAVRRVLDSLRASASLVVVNAPPVGRSPSTLVWAGLADATLIVVPRDRTTRRSLRRAAEALRGADGNVAGAVLSGG